MLHYCSNVRLNRGKINKPFLFKQLRNTQTILNTELNNLNYELQKKHPSIPLVRDNEYYEKNLALTVHKL